jgi:hypothetical protein
MAAGVLLMPFPAQAALGEHVSTVQADAVQMRGALMRVERTSLYAVHEVRTATGTVVREFVSPSGTVFAVAWQGPWLPDLRQLLGTHFEQYRQAAQTAKADRSGRRPLLIETAGLIVELSGHPRAFVGRAYLTALLPQGVRADAIR